MKIGEKLRLKITGYGINGEGVAKIKNTVVFVPFAMVGEVVLAEVEKIKKNIATAKIVEILTPNPTRKTPPCPYFTTCGGCDLMHIPHDQQLELKKQSLSTTLSKMLGNGHEVKNCKKSDFFEFYRNKIELAVCGEEVGFFCPASHKIVCIDDCKLSAFSLKKFLQIARKNLTNNQNIRGIVIRKLGQNYCFVLVTNTAEKLKASKWIDDLKTEFVDFCLFQNINTKNTSEVFGDKFVCLYGSQTQKFVQNGISFDVSPYSFLQINQCVADKIYAEVLQNIDQNSVCINAYSGAGLLTAMLAKKCQKVFGVEINADASRDADKLMKKNGIKNVQNICGDCAKKLPYVVKMAGQQNLNFVVDPNRKGLDKKVVEAILLAKPAKIIYVSCNPATLARDLKALKTDYKISLIQPYDMFPNTRHIETLCVLNKK